jgi:hypothetical protein
MVGVIIAFSTLNPDEPPFNNAALRFCEVIIGSVVAVAFFWAWMYLFGDHRIKSDPGPIQGTRNKKD